MHFRLKIAVLACVLVLGSQFGSATAKRRKPVQAPTPPPVQEAPPPPPQPPPTPEQMPAMPPRVSMENGMLTISAENSTMGDILGAVKKQTGATLDVPPALSSERVATKLGPGVPRDVVQQLFAGSKFDYIIVGSPQDPNGLQRIIVTARGSGASGPAVANNQPPPQNSYQPQGGGDINEMDEEPQPEPQPEVQQPEQQTVTPPTGAQPYSNQPKTPEQLLQELQQMQQQQQQQQGGPERPPRGAIQQAPPQ